MTTTRARRRLPAAPVTGYVCSCPEPHRQPGPDAEEVDLYLRISSDKRLGGIEQVAVERQTREVCKMCGERNWRIVRVWTDNDISATSGEYRPAFEGTLLYPATRVIVTYHSDRYVRLLRELERVIDKGILVHAVHAGTHDLATATGRATARTVTTWAQHEGELKSVRQKSQNRQSAVNGEPRWWPRVPFGYNADHSQNPKQAAALRKVYDNLLMGATMVSQIRWLNDQGLISNTGAKWAHGSLRHVIMSPRNAGIRTYTTTLHKGTAREERIIEEIGKGDWEPIVPEPTYRAVVALLSDPVRFTGGPRTGKEPTYLLTKLAVCAECGGGIKVNRRGGKDVPEDKRFGYYVCRENRCVNYRVDSTDSIVLRKVISLLQEPEFRSAWGGADPVNVEPAIMEKARIQESLKELAEDRVMGLLSRDAMLSATEKANKRIDEINTLLAQAGSAGPIADLLADLDYVWQEMTKEGEEGFNRRRQIVMSVCKRIALTRQDNRRGVQENSIIIEPRMPGDVTE